MRASVLATLLLACGLPAAAQYAEIGVTVGYGRYRDGEIYGVGNEGGFSQTYHLGNGVRVGARMSFDFRSYFAHEVTYAWQNAPFRVTVQEPGTTSVSDQGSNSHHYYYNFVAHMTPRDSRVRPFVTGGGGVSTYIPPGFSALSSGGDTQLGYNYGAGIKFLLTERYGLRFDVRDHVTGKPYFRNVPGRLHNVETSATFSFLF